MEPAQISRIDATVPKIKTNFKSFGKDEDDKIYFNSEQIAKIEVTEHNFNASDMGVSVEEKEVGTSHTSGGNWRSISYYSDPSLPLKKPSNPYKIRV